MRFRRKKKGELYIRLLCHRKGGIGDLVYFDKFHVDEYYTLLGEYGKGENVFPFCMEFCPICAGKVEQKGFIERLKRATQVEVGEEDRVEDVYIHQ